MARSHAVLCTLGAVARVAPILGSVAWIEADAGDAQERCSVLVEGSMDQRARSAGCVAVPAKHNESTVGIERFHSLIKRVRTFAGKINHRHGPLLKWSVMLMSLFWTIVYQLGSTVSDLPDFVYVNF